MAAGVTTTTTLAASAAGTPIASGGSVNLGTVITLTATVASQSSTPKTGLVSFCETSGLACTDIHLIATAQLTSAGTATYTFTPPLGAHSYKAVFAGTPNGAASYSSSSSASVSITVIGLYPSVTTVLQQFLGSGLPFDVIVGNAGASPPTGTVSFVDTSDGNAVLASDPLESQCEFPLTLDCPSAGAAGLTFLMPGNLTFAYPSENGNSGFSYATGLVGLAAGDFNGDGHLDLAAIASSGMNMGGPWDAAVTVLLGDGRGNFIAGPVLDLGASLPVTLFATGDFNGDGIPDLALGASNQTITILLGKGDGTFTAQPDIAVGGNFVSMVTGDFNGDGVADLALLSNTANSIILFAGKGDGTFAPSSAPISSAGPTPFSMLTADFNGDGVLDLAIPNNNNSTPLVVLLGKGDGSFTSVSSPITYNHPYGGLTGFATGDFNGDGIADLVFSNSDNTITIYLGRGDGTFTEAPNPLALQCGVIRCEFFVGDFNGDGKADLLGPGVLLGNGDGTFSTATHPWLPSIIEGFGSDLLAVADFNGDGTTDVAGATGIALAVTQTSFVSDYTVTAPPASGSNLVLASYAGDSANSPSESGTISLMGPQALPTVNLTATPNPGVANETVTLSATVNGSGVAPTGTVTFYDGSALLGSGTLNSSGTATFAATTLAAGSHAVTASYAGDSNYLAANSQAVTVTIAASAMTITTPTPSPVAAGATATATVTIAASQGYSGTVNLTCALTNLPAGAQSLPACSLKPASLTLNSGASGTATLAVTTAAATASSAARPASSNLFGIGGGTVVLAGLLVLWRPSRRRWLAVVALGCLLAAPGLISCSGGSKQSPGIGGTPATTAGSYTFTITATDAANSSIHNSTNVSVTVQ